MYVQEMFVNWMNEDQRKASQRRRQDCRVGKSILGWNAKAVRLGCSELVLTGWSSQLRWGGGKKLDGRACCGAGVTSPAQFLLSPLHGLTSFMVSMEAKYLDHQSSMLSSGSSSSGSSELPFFFFFFFSFSSSAWRVGQVKSPVDIAVPWPFPGPWTTWGSPIHSDHLLPGSPGPREALWGHHCQRAGLCLVEEGAMAGEATTCPHESPAKAGLARRGPAAQATVSVCLFGRHAGMSIRGLGGSLPIVDPSA